MNEGYISRRGGYIRSHTAHSLTCPLACTAPSSGNGSSTGLSNSMYPIPTRATGTPYKPREKRPMVRSEPQYDVGGEQKSYSERRPSTTRFVLGYVCLVGKGGWGDVRRKKGILCEGLRALLSKPPPPHSLYLSPRPYECACPPKNAAKAKRYEQLANRLLYSLGPPLHNRNHN